MNKAIVICDIAPLYTKPSTQSELGDEALFGMTVEILGQVGGFVKIKTHYRYEGYVPKRCLFVDNAAVNAWEKVEKHVVTHPYLDILKKPEVQAAKHAHVPRGGLVMVKSFDEVNAEGFIEVMLPDGKNGFTKAVCLGARKTSWDKARENELRAAIVETARGYMGTQYRWGGKTPLGIDCSGLTSMAYLLNGSMIYRDARIMPGFDMHEITREQMKAGDLLFFKGHVAMYTGGGMYIHSTAHKSAFGVTVNSLTPDHPLYRADLAEGILAIGSIF